MRQCLIVTIASVGYDVTPTPEISQIVLTSESSSNGMVLELQKS